jgi:hypothetical protein
LRLRLRVTGKCNAFPAWGKDRMGQEKISVKGVNCVKGLNRVYSVNNR